MYAHLILISPKYGMSSAYKKNTKLYSILLYKKKYVLKRINPYRFEHSCSADGFRFRVRQFKEGQGDRLVVTRALRRSFQQFLG